MDLRERIREAINCASAENGSDTPDFILAEYLTDCLAAFDKATTRRTRYFAPTEDGKPVPVSLNHERDFTANVTDQARGRRAKENA